MGLVPGTLEFKVTVVVFLEVFCSVQSLGTHNFLSIGSANSLVL